MQFGNLRHAVNGAIPISVTGFEANIVAFILRSPHGVAVFAANDIFSVNKSNLRPRRNRLHRRSSLADSLFQAA